MCLSAYEVLNEVTGDVRQLDEVYSRHAIFGTNGYYKEIVTYLESKGCFIEENGQTKVNVPESVDVNKLEVANLQ